VRDLGERSFLELDGTGIADAENLVSEAARLLAVIPRDHGARRAR
jgi:hypothetical protein